MPELTLADVERLERGTAKCLAAIKEHAAMPDWPITDANLRARKKAEKQAQSALKAMQGVGGKYLPALLALAREALERRPKEQPCRDCDDTGEFYGNLNIACGCPAGAKFTPRAEESPDA